jgi:nicotinate phosphoribosyltransferase
MYIMASPSEDEAFRGYSELFPTSTYLVDTYDTLRGTSLALESVGDGVSAVRIDSGDLGEVSREVRALLKEEGREDVGIVLSSDLDEYEIQRLAKEGDFDAAGVGTRLATSEDSPSLGGVYKLVQIGDRPVAKLSQNKVTYPGPHQIYRHEKDGVFEYDQLGLNDERSYEFLQAQALLVPVVESGRPVRRETIHDARARCRAELQKLPSEVRDIGVRSDEYASHFEVRPSARLLELLEQCREELEEKSA